MTTASPWKIKAEGTGLGMVADAAEVRRALELFADPSLGMELMALTKGVHRTRPGSDLDGLCAAVAELPSGVGIYFRCNPVAADRTASANNGDIVKRNWLFIDVDPVKPEAEKSNPATDAEKARTGPVCDAINEYLRERGWPAPVVTDSGNGYGMLYRCDLPNDKLVQSAYQRLLKELSAKFGGETCIIDKAVHNANRLVKLPGTWARKGVQSDDRPHRPCRLVYVPADLGSVTFELLRDTLTAEPTPDPIPVPAPPSGPRDERREAAYARRAMDSECARVVLSAGTGEGRNNALNRAAFCLGQLVAGGLLIRAEVEARLYAAAVAVRLHEDDGGERGVHATIASGMRAGLEHPRGVPDRKADPIPVFGKGGSDAKGAEPLTVSLSKVEPLTVDWLIRGRIPKRFITVMAGRTGVGKSFVCHDLIARLSQGEEIPFSGGECFTPGGTLILSEDSHEYVIVPRLMEAGADLTRVHAMTWAAMSRYSLGDTDMLTQAAAEVPGGVSLVLIDPPTNFLGETNENRNSEVRQLVMRVVEWCLSRDLAAVFILHVNKGGGAGVEALSRVMGSVAWVTTARIAHALCPDPDEPGRCLWMPLKSNIGPLPKTLAYEIAASPGAATARVKWVGEVDRSADEAMSAPVEAKKKRTVAASDWLTELFEGTDRVESDALWRDARKVGVSRNAILEAKDEMGIRAKQELDGSGKRIWVWTWHPDARKAWADKPKGKAH